MIPINKNIILFIHKILFRLILIRIGSEPRLMVKRGSRNKNMEKVGGKRGRVFAVLVSIHQKGTI